MEAGAGGHVFPDDAWGFEAEGVSDVDGVLGFDDEAEGAEGGEEFGGLGPVEFGIVEVGDEGEFVEAEDLGLWGEGERVVDDVVGAEVEAPIAGGGAGGGGDDGEACGFGEGDEGGADSACAVDDEDGFSC